MIRCRFCEREFPSLPDTAIVLRSKPKYILVQFQDAGKSVHQFTRSDLVNPPEPHIEPELPKMIVIPAPVRAVDAPLQELPESPTPQPPPWPWITETTVHATRTRN